MAFSRAGNGRPSGRSNGGGFGGGRGGGRDFGGGRGGGRDFGGGGRPALELFDVTCAQCGKHTQVPFKPTGERPVLCRDCFQGSAPARDGPRRDGPRDSGNSSELQAINEKLDKIMQALDIE